MDNILETIGVLALVALILYGLCYVFAVLPQNNQCAQAGYSAHKTVRGVGLCIGKVLIDGELVWAAEPVSDIRE